jgi:hypothetical protein
MVERRNGYRLTLEPAAELGMSGLDSDFPPQARVAGSKNLAHPALPQTADDLVRPHLCARGPLRIV